MSNVMEYTKIADPMKLAAQLWPDVYFYQKQKDIIRSVWDNRETVVPAGNMLGKDFVAGYIAVAFFMAHNPCRVVTTSAKDDHLDVLWGEIGRFIDTAKYGLETSDGGSLIVNHHHITKIVGGRKCKISYLKGLVSSPNRIAAMQGHHAKYTLFICDESSSVPDEYYTMASTWAKKLLIIGNPWPCTNFFFRAVEGNNATGDPGGDSQREDGSYYRKVIHIDAEDSPSVRLGLTQKARGTKPTDEELVPGVKPYSMYIDEQQHWDEEQISVSHRGRFYKGDRVMLFPEVWLEEAMQRADEMYGKLFASIVGVTSIRPTSFEQRSLGCDPAEGRDSTVFTPAHKKGLFCQISRKTPDTSVVFGETIGLMREYSVPAPKVVFDRGGGGQQHADYLRRAGYNVSTVFFGESVVPEKRRGSTPLERRKLEDEERYTYKNRRAHMYGILSQLINPANEYGFAIPRSCRELIRQLKAVPRLYDGEGRIWLPPKRKLKQDSTEETMKDLIGCSPDEADSAVLATFILYRKSFKAKAGGPTR